MNSPNSPLVAYQVHTKILPHQPYRVEFVGLTLLANVLQLLSTAHDRWKSNEKAAAPLKPFINSMKCIAWVYTKYTKISINNSLTWYLKQL